MLPLQSYCGFESFGVVEEPSSIMKSTDGGDSTLSSGTTATRKSLAACKSHSEAERRRRQRINDHLTTLRTLLPNKTKTDKASLLAEVVQHVKELKKQAADVAAGQDGDGCSSSSSGSSDLLWSFPSESDEVTLSFCEGLVKATVCCEDRPGLNRDLTQAIRSVRARAVRAEMATVGGRTKNVVVMQCEEDEDIGTLKRALKAVVDNRVSGSGLAHMLSGINRGRFRGSINGDGGK
nr:basic helix-loop-helix transcription factor [Loropetalum chinense var. rubrum]